MNDFEKAVKYLECAEAFGIDKASQKYGLLFGTMHENVFHWAEWLCRNNPEFLGD